MVYKINIPLFHKTESSVYGNSDYNFHYGRQELMRPYQCNVLNYFLSHIFWIELCPELELQRSFLLYILR